MHLNIALAQINTQLGNMEANLEKHLSCIRDARQNGADLILFPELSLTGYTLQDLVPSVAIPTRRENPVFSRLLKESLEIDIVVGFVNEDIRHRFLYRRRLPLQRQTCPYP